MYQNSGGFAAVRQEPLEDLALGRYLHGLGYRVPMLRGEDVAQVAMYTSRDQLWRGMSRVGAGSLSLPTRAAMLTSVYHGADDAAAGARAGFDRRLPVYVRIDLGASCRHFALVRTI
ncbi:MAG: hypothetical protein H6667_05010 [Ardenticatenaceae bacterium]|nr:hypothetical protein [Ardenticatenaceae bacterium]